MEEGKIKVTINGVEHEWKSTRSGPIQVSEGTIEVAGETWKASSVKPITPEPEIDYDVEYAGETYTRLAYENENTKAEGEITGESLYLLFTLRGIQFARFDIYSTNLGTGSDNQYIALELDRESQYIESFGDEKNECVSFYAVSGKGDYLYFEIFGKVGEQTKTNIYKYTGSEWDSDQNEIEDLGPYTLARIKLTNYEDMTPVCTLGHIPQYQPTK